MNLATIQDATGFQREKLKDDAVAALVVNDETRRGYINLARNVETVFKSLLPDPAASEFGPIRKVLSVIAEKIRSEIPAPDISGVLDDVANLLDTSIATEGYVIRPSALDKGTANYLDLSQIDFEALRKQFANGRKTTEAQKLRGKVAQKLGQMILLNRTRMDFLQEFERMIEEYNSGASNIEAFFARLMAFTQKLSDEDKRGIAEKLTEEELVIFDLLTKPDVNLTKREEIDVKKAAKTLLESLQREKLVLDWRKRQATRAMVRYTIETVLETELPRVYTKEMYDQKCDVVYQHFYNAYYGQGKGLYGTN